MNSNVGSEQERAGSVGGVAAGRPRARSAAIVAAAGGLLGVMLSGCKVGPDYNPPVVAMPGAFGSAPSGLVATTQESDPTRSAHHAMNGASTRPGRLAGQLADLAHWWQGFDDPVLTDLVERAVVNNLNVRQAQGRLREARALLGVQSADLFPNVEYGASYSRSRNSGNGFGGFGGGTTGGGTTGGGSGGSSGFSGGGGNGGWSSFYRTGFDASWELDVFGGIRRGVEASRGDVEAAVEDRNNVILSLISEVATNYVLLRGAQQRIRIANDNIESQRQTLKLNEARLEAGISSEFDVARARAQVATFEATVPPLRIQEAQAVHRIGVLLGASPASMAEELASPAQIPMALPSVPVGLPSELLRRRPDVRRAERQLAAATARIGVATADLFPRFSLTGSFGTQTTRSQSFLDARSIFASVGPAVSWNIFDAGRIRSNILVQNARQEQALANYEQTILTSLEDVENAVVAYTRNIQRREALARAVVASQRSVDLATGRFAGGQGVGNLLDVLVAQRDLFSAEDALVASDTDLSQNLVALYKALGGGWEDYSAPTSVPAPEGLGVSPSTRPTGATTAAPSARTGNEGEAVAAK